MDNKIIEEFESKQRMPVEMKKAAMRMILKNLMMVVIILVLLSVICFMDEKLIKETLSTGLKALATVLIVISIIFFEIAYRKEKPGIGLWAIEFMILGLIVMFVPYLSQYIQSFIIGIAVVFGIYYLIKLFGIVIHKKKEFSDKKSDIKELVKEEKESYLDEVSKKKFENKKN